MLCLIVNFKDLIIMGIYLPDWHIYYVNSLSKLTKNIVQIFKNSKIPQKCNIIPRESRCLYGSPSINNHPIIFCTQNFWHLKTKGLASKFLKGKVRGACAYGPQDVWRDVVRSPRAMKLCNWRSFLLPVVTRRELPALQLQRGHIYASGNQIARYYSIPLSAKSAN